ncbi:hypothetical protein BpHYR1_006526 [Brachionus plicatilis]|uniref:Uncharacterized protein n=1 Tax=Brachionus plicatilis TaxID=10195 RepID=A0A3M7PL12_BRAPC|nr:hypothetical protein BpHYR1_006526 [Brachionus plicatilis]
MYTKLKANSVEYFISTFNRKLGFDNFGNLMTRAKISHVLIDITLLICIYSESAQSHLENGVIDILAKNVRGLSIFGTFGTKNKTKNFRMK